MTNEHEIEFDPDEIVAIPPFVNDHIRDYVDVLADTYSRLVETAADAVNQFESAMLHASTREADPDILGALFSVALDKAVTDVLGGIGRQVPAIPILFDMFNAARDELNRAEDARQSTEVRDFVRRQREIVVGMRDRFDRTTVKASKKHVARTTRRRDAHSASKAAVSRKLGWTRQAAPRSAPAPA